MEQDKKHFVVEIVEDETALRKVLRDAFVSQGFEVVEAENGQEGLDFAFSKHPDLILLDIMMPVMDGLTMLTKLRDFDKESKIPVILLSNLNDVKNISAAVSLGAKDYLVKTAWKLEDVVAKVSERLKV